MTDPKVGDATILVVSSNSTIDLNKPRLATDEEENRILAGWLDGLTATPSAQLLSAVDACVRGAAEILQGSTAWEDTIRAGIQAVPQCRTVVQAVQGSADQPTVARSADDIVRAGSRFGAWDDFARLLGKAARLFP